MNLLSVEDLSLNYGEKVLFRSVGFGLNEGERIALVGKNGTGKTSLLETISGDRDAESGRVVYRKGIQVGYLAQEDVLESDMTILDAVLDDAQEPFSTIKQFEVALAENNSQSIQELSEKIDQLNVWNIEHRVKEVLSNLKIDQTHQSTKTLSGGQRKRIALARLLIHNPDLMILDEPTNHLDLEMIKWLESYIMSSANGLLLVSHDRTFIDNICNRIIELEDGSIFNYKGGYQYFLSKRSERLQNEETQREKATNLFRKELDWYRRQPKARGTKSKKRMEGVEQLKQKSKRIVESELLIPDMHEPRLGSKILELHNASKTFGDRTLFSKFDYKFLPSDRVGLIGNNGSGKSTFIRLLTGALATDTGKVVHGETLQISHYQQDGLRVDEGKRVIDVVKDIAEVFPLKKGKHLSAAQMLELFLFPRNKQGVRVDQLSGGEKKRLHLVQILMKNPNFLILDEPTNDFDLFTIQVLEEFLYSFKGCLVVASHDRYFLDRIVDHVFVFGAPQIKDFPGNYSQYEASIRLAPKPKERTEPGKPKEKRAREKTKLSYHEQLEFDGLEDEIEQLKTEKLLLEKKLSDDSQPHERIQQAAERLSSVLELIDEKEMRWLELSEYA
ncbi:MAG TPA: ABC transporter [Flavobacteriales bacterium]|jgi:ATP-binding cassette subfamily F protein uup|nr:ABC transporter [Flavobacteriales bacterium]